MKQIYELALSNVKGVGAATHRKIVETLGSAEEFFSLTNKELADLKIEAFDKNVLLDKAKEAVKKNSELGVSFCSYEDDEYPKILRTINQPPPFLFYVGDISILEKRKKMAIVGTRDLSDYGRVVTEYIVEQAVHDDVVIVSGLASGIDGVSHRKTIECGGKTAAVIGCGFMYQYPAENAKLYHDIVESGGVIISEFFPYEKPNALNFPRRNRVVAALSNCTLVVESKKKGGSLITAEYALELNRDVFSIPGSIFNLQSEGCHQLIAQGANIVTSGYKDIRDVMNWDKDEVDAVFSHTSMGKPEITSQAIVNDKVLDDKDDDLVYQFLKGNENAQIDFIVKNLGIPHPKLLAQLSIMELRGYVSVMPGMRYKVV